MNKKETILIRQMGVFFFLIILTLGLLVINEKKKEIFQDKIDKKFNNYINENYKEIKDDLKINKIEYKNKKYIKRLENKNNKNLYFTLTYKDKKITSTYNTDYKDGNTLISTLNKKLNKILKDKMSKNPLPNTKISISYNIKLSNCTDVVRRNLINEKFSLPIYTLNIDKTIPLNKDNINKEIISINDYMENLNLNPKNLSLTLTDQNNITNTINIIINYNTLKNKDLNIGEIIESNNKDILDKYDIIIKKLN